MKRKVKFIPVSIVITFILAAYLTAQVREPKIPRWWWSSVKEYIQDRAASKMFSFINYGTPTDQVIAVFTPQQNITIERIDVYARAKVDGDTTAFVVANGLSKAQVVIDSGGAAQYWFDSTEVDFTALKPCTLKFSDDDFSGNFTTGADTASIIIQYRVSN